MNDSSINIDYNKYYTQTLSDSSMESIRERTNREDMLNSLMYAGGATGVGVLAYTQAKRNESILESVQKLPGANILSNRLNKAYNGEGFINPASASGPQPLSRSLHSMLLAAEEATPLHLAKTLGLASFQTLFVEVIDQEKGSIKIGSDSIRAYSEYYRNLILNSTGYALTKRDIDNGFILENDKLYLANRDGSRGRELLGYARAINTNLEIGEQDSPNRVFQKFANIHGTNVHVSQAKVEPIAIVGGSSRAQTLQDWGRAYGRFSTEIGFKVLDNPLGFVEEMAGNAGVDTKNNKLFNNKFTQTFQKHFNLGLGSDGIYNQGNRAAMKIMAKNLTYKAIGAYTTYVGVNALLEKVTSEDNPWHDGIGAGAAHTYAKMRVGLAKIWSDPLQSIRTEQEEAAPESTSLASLAAFPLGGAMLGANIAYFKRMRDIATKGFDEGARINTEIKKFDGTLGRLLDNIKLNPEGTTLARYGKLGGLVGAALTLPFLPGALVGKSSEELEAEFSGAADVGIRRNRGWLMGGNAFEGDSIKYFRKSSIKEIATDARNKTLYEDGKQQRKMDPLYSPFEYLKNPYAFEEAHQHDMPYAVWGMDVTYGSFMGKIFQGTVGQLIKPTIVNPEFLKQVEEQRNAEAILSRKKGAMTVEEIREAGLPSEGFIMRQVPTPSGEYTAKLFYNSRDLENTDYDIEVIEPSTQPTRQNAENFEVTVKESRRDHSMQQDGLMLKQQSATVNPTEEAAVGAYAAFSDFTGLKGFTGGLVLGGLGLDPADQVAPKLAVSGSANTLVDRYQSLQLGDAMGCFVPSTYILTEDGYRKIKDIKVGDRVLSRSSKLRTVAEVYVKDYSQEILKLRLQDNTIIFVTPDHVFPGTEYISGNIEERAIGKWEEGDMLFKQLTDDFDTKQYSYGSQLLRIEEKEVVWYKGPMYDLLIVENNGEPSTEYTNYYTVEDILCHNSGEFVRRLLPQSADTRREEINPIKNSVAPSWLPRDPNRDFSTGNYYDKVADIGYTMLPGSRGFNALHPELEGIDPENYSDAWKYKILQNVARGSREHYAYRDKLVNNLDTLSDYDKDVFFSAYEQDMARNEEKRFFEYKTEEDKKGMNVIQLAQNAIWENIAHLESPTEPLTPFRPMAKFLHHRTAIEDYRKTQLAGTDAAIWTKPIDHFIKPSINRTVHLVNDVYKPKDVQEKENIDEYFDNLKLVKASKGRPMDAQSTVVSSAYSGMRTAEDMQAFRRALPDNQKAYVESFASEKNERKRAEILEMLPNNVGRVYRSIWANMDTFDKAVKDGRDPNEDIRDLYLRETEALRKETGITLSRQEVEGINKASFKIRDKEERERFIAEEQAAKIRAKAAQQEAQAYVEATTGTPDSSWIGWDKRLTVDDIKLKTLSVGKEDITRFGYWDKEKQRNDRIIALDNDDQVVNRLSEIKKRLRDNQNNKHALKRRLQDQGYDVEDISVSPGVGQVNINTD